ncbi:PREDICTED: protein phosphatase 1 regulatory subunit 3C [Nicrophorus vespilloides]|uniref:Protein phosphatase 1 regulatory subunit n=1 Tax=Nicrophorus vespilloides TaxID=110193 RepID=A0ABM1MHK4_NICVS|nr:PREDICTED: protein phosphatase 1 regulatory subunit 3C [Nicrophorus vespilloides]
MCSIVMQTDYEKLVAAHTPPIFSHSPPTTANFLSRYEPSPFVVARYKPIKVCSTSSPKRPCLVIRQSDDSSSSGDEDPTSPSRLKKRVVFADDKGMSLTHVRFMTEPSHLPPHADKVIRYASNGARHVTTPPTIPSPPTESWEITFSQPASDYLRFRKAVDMNKVSLENVIIKESDSYVMGTVKVSNIAFEKEVVVRCSTDNWCTHEDVLCRFVSNYTGSSIYAIYDTFSFKLPLPKTTSRTLEFCICYRCGGQEFWDNNDNLNLTRSLQKVTTLQPSDIFNTKVDSWSEFASWTHLDTTNPYW